MSQEPNDKPAREFWIAKLDGWDGRVYDKDPRTFESGASPHTVSKVVDAEAYQALKLENEELKDALNKCAKEAITFLDRVTSEEDENRKLKAESAELRVKLADFRIGAEQNEIYISQGEQISDLQSEVARLRVLLKKHHDWHLDFTEVPKEFVGINMAAEYCESTMCDETLEALNHKPKGEKE